MTGLLAVTSATPDGDHIGVRVAGDLDFTTCRTLILTVNAHLVQGIAHVTLDASALDFCDSAGLGALVTMHRTLLRIGGTLVIRHPRGPVSRLFALTGLDTVLTVVHAR